MIVTSTRFRHLGALGFWAAIAVAVIYTLFPLYWAIATSLKDPATLFDFELFPAAPTSVNYLTILSTPSFLRSILTSAIVAGSVVALSLAVSVPAAYAFARLRFAGRRGVLFSILCLSMFPQITLLPGMFLLVRNLGLFNSPGALILSYQVLTVPFTVWVLTGFMRALPREIEDAARIDGCSSWQTIRHVFLPLMAPALVTTGLLAFILAWHEFLFALTFVLSEDSRTVPVAIGLISGASRHELPYGAVMTAATIVTLPLVLLVYIFQRHIVAGLTQGAVKG